MVLCDEAWIVPDAVESFGLQFAFIDLDSEARTCGNLQESGIGDKRRTEEGFAEGHMLLDEEIRTGGV